MYETIGLELIRPLDSSGSAVHLDSLPPQAAGLVLGAFSISEAAPRLSIVPCLSDLAYPASRHTPVFPDFYLDYLPTQRRPCRGSRESFIFHMGITQRPRLRLVSVDFRRGPDIALTVH